MCSAGDNYLGGEDFTQAIIKACLSGENEMRGNSRDRLARLYDSAEQLKCQLGQHNATHQLCWQWRDQAWTLSFERIKTGRDLVAADDPVARPRGTGTARCTPASGQLDHRCG